MLSGETDAAESRGDDLFVRSMTAVKCTEAATSVSTGGSSYDRAVYNLFHSKLQRYGRSCQSMVIHTRSELILRGGVALAFSMSCPPQLSAKREPDRAKAKERAEPRQQPRLGWCW